MRILSAAALTILLATAAVLPAAPAMAVGQHKPTEEVKKLAPEMLAQMMQQIMEQLKQLMGGGGGGGGGGGEQPQSPTELGGGLQEMRDQITDPEMLKEFDRLTAELEKLEKQKELAEAEQDVSKDYGAAKKIDDFLKDDRLGKAITATSDDFALFDGNQDLTKEKIWELANKRIEGNSKILDKMDEMSDLAMAEADDINSKLADPALSATEKAALKAELAKLKAATDALDKKYDLLAGKTDTLEQKLSNFVAQNTTTPTQQGTNPVTANNNSNGQPFSNYGYSPSTHFNDNMENLEQLNGVNAGNQQTGH